MKRRVLILIALGAFCACSRPTITGRAAVIDGDTLKIDNKSIHLFGVDAPEPAQRCTREGRSWACGRAATGKLRELTANQDLTCEQQDTDADGGIVAVCRSGDTDIASEMVLAGLALTYPQSSGNYANEEDQARQEHRGLWAGDFTPPWTLRAEAKQ